MFDPKAHLIQLPRRVKDPQTGQWTTRLDEYLEVKWRVLMFRERYPHGVITTEAWLIDWAQGVAVCQATVDDGEGGKASAFGTETRKSFEDFVEKAGTRAVGRALALLGFGTQFVGEELSEGEHVADAPAMLPSKPGVVNHSPKKLDKSYLVSDSLSNKPVASPGEGPQHGPAEPHPTADEIDTLVDSARSANVSNDDFAHDMRRLLQLPDGQKITKKFLRESMTMAQYNTARAHYGEKLRQILEEDVPDHGSPQKDDQLHAPEGASKATGENSDQDENLRLDQSAEPNATEAGLVEARAKLRAEAIGWGVRESEVDHVLQHHPVEKARVMLWRARRNHHADDVTMMAVAD